MVSFPGGPVDKNLLSNAGDVGSIPGRRTNTLHALEQLNPGGTAAEPRRLSWRACKLQTAESMHSGAHGMAGGEPVCPEPMARLEGSLCATTKTRGARNR